MYPRDNSCDLTIFTHVRLADGVGRQGIGLYNCLKDSIKNINFFHMYAPNYDGLDREFVNKASESFSGCGKIAFNTSILGINELEIAKHKNISSDLRIAYSMFESDRIPDFWTRILNSYYDVVIVPDPYLVDVYRNSNVKIPIGVLPLGIMIEDFINAEQRIWNKKDPFIFGMTGGFWARKNHIKLMQAFLHEFKTDENVQLKLHGRFGSYQAKVFEFYNENIYATDRESQIQLFSNVLSQKEYVEFMNGLDCYVFPSMGEGFSITPREAMALGKPVIVTNNSVHKTLVDKDLVWPVEANIQIPAQYEVFGNKKIGNYYDCSIEDLGKQMRFVYENNYSGEIQSKISKAFHYAKNECSWYSLKTKYEQFLNKNKRLNTRDMNSFEKLPYLEVKDNEIITNDSNLYFKLDK